MGSWTKPTTKQIEAVLARIDEPHRRAYFLSRLNNPLWIEPLWRRGFFRHPPDPIADPETGSFRHPPWPDSEYLARMACHDPAGVVEILEVLPESDNVLVHRDIVTAILAMNGDHAGRLLPKVMNLLNREMMHGIEDRVCDLIGKFAGEGMVDEAICLARQALKLSPAVGGTDSYLDYRNRPEALLDDWWYQKILEEDVTRLVLVAPMKTIRLLLGILDGGIAGTEVPGSVGRDEWLDWVRAAIDEDAPEWKLDPVQLLISAVRDAARSAWLTHQGRRQEVLEQLECFRWKIGARIALDVLAAADCPPLDWVRPRLLHYRNFSDYLLRHEYKRLLCSTFDRLDEVDRETLLGWIHAGPDLDQSEVERSPEDVARYISGWQREWLAVIAESLDESWRGRFEELLEDPALGQFETTREHAEGVFEWIGPASPKSPDELNTMPVEEIVAFLKSWSPSASHRSTGGLREPSVEGLSRALAETVESRATEFARAAEAFIGQESAYIWPLASGLRRAIASGAGIGWKAVLNLCEWVNVQAHRDQIEPGQYSWSFTRQEFAGLLRAGFDNSSESIPFALRQRVWATLEPILHDPDPTIEHEKRFGPPNQDPLTLSINTTRGTAMAAVIGYAMWTLRNIDKSEGHVESPGFGAMPEVRDVLERHLQPANDPSLAVRSVYGRYLPWLARIDTSWVEAHLEQIFPTAAELNRLRNAAWISFLSRAPYTSIFGLLHEQYVDAIQRMPSPEDSWLSDDNPDQKLSEHILDLYLIGEIELLGKNSLLRGFYDRCDVDLKSAGNAYLGWRLTQADEAAKRFADRAQAFWEWRVSSIREVPDSGAAAELHSFVSWIDAACFEPDWVVEKLYEALQVDVPMERSVSLFMASKWLSGNVERISRKEIAVRCLGGIVESQRQRWFVSIFDDDFRTVLKAAMSSGDVSARVEANRFVEILVSRGYPNPLRPA